MFTAKTSEYIELCDTLDPECKAGPDLSRLWQKLSRREQVFVMEYYRSVAEGCAPKLAEMLAARQPPGAVTDATFLAGHCNGNQFEDSPKRAEAMQYLAQRHGVDTKGKVYLGQLAAYPGDPQAWVTGRGAVERVCRQRGWGCEGAVNVPNPDVKPNTKPKRKPLKQKLYEAGVPTSGD